MELIDVSGYVPEEKIAIARRYVIPNTLKDSGLMDDQVRALATQIYPRYLFVFNFVSVLNNLGWVLPSVNEL